MSRHRWFIALLLLVIASVLVTSCSQQAQPTQPPAGAESGGTAEEGEVEEYVVIALNWAHPYWTDIITGGEYFDEVMGDKVKVTFAGPQDPDFPGQVDAVIQQIPKKPAGMLVACFDPGVIPAINQAIDAGIPVGTFEADIPSMDNKRWFFCGVDPYKAGWAMGPELLKYAGESGKFIYSTNIGASNSEAKIRGFNDFIADYPGWELVATVEDEAQAREGADNLKPVLQANPDVTAIIGINAGSGAAAGTAVKELGLEGKIVIVTQDRDDITLQLIDEGVIKSTVVTRTAVNTYFGLLALYQYNHFDVPITDDNAAANVVWLPTNIDVGTFVVDESNTSYFYK
jgi:ribose transport system substrate-binding protein